MKAIPTTGLAALFPEHCSCTRRTKRRGARGYWQIVRQRRAGPSSSGTLHHKSLDSRRQLCEEIRCLYEEISVKAHGEDNFVIDCEENGLNPSPGDAASGNDAAVLEPIPEAAASATTRLLASKKKRKIVCKLAGVEVVSEKIKAHLGIIAAALVSDMSYDLRGAVAKDPRIERRCIMPRKQLEKEILRKYKAEMSQKRKDKLVLMNAVSKLSISGLSSKAYCTLRAVLNDMGLRAVLPSEKDLRQVRGELFKLCVADLQIFPTPDGWFVSPRAVVEMEILRLMQQVDGESGRNVGIGPDDGHRWQDHFNVKITLDARRITKRTSQTEVMLLIIPKGQDGVDCCQKAISIRTVGIWMGKDSGANVQANMGPFFKEIASLEQDGVLFCPHEGKLLGIWERYQERTQEDRDEMNLRKVTLTFWHGADMAAQCAVLGHGCSGHHYCGHCNAHRDERHIPYELHKVQSDINFQELANELDMFPKTLYSINAAADDKKVLHLSEDGLRACTRESTICEESVGCNAGVDVAMGEAGEAAEMRRPAKRRRGERQAIVKMSGVCKGPNAAVLKQLVGWQKEHLDSCCCSECLVPANTGSGDSPARLRQGVNLAHRALAVPLASALPLLCPALPDANH